MVQHLQRALGRASNGGMDWIEVENANGMRTRYDDQETIENKIMEMNERCFHLTKTTPPMQEPLLGQLGYLGNMEAAKQILEGTYEYPPGMSPATQQFLEALPPSDFSYCRGGYDPTQGIEGGL